MADISRYIEKINKAKYGEEVRGSISDALTAMNEEAENAKEWATGEGTDVPGGGSVPGTENNAEYYAQQAAAVLEEIPEDYSTLSKKVNSLEKTTVENYMDVFTVSSKTGGGLTWTPNGDGSITVVGTSVSTNNIINYYSSRNVLPSWAVLGKKYHLDYASNSVRFLIYWYRGNTLSAAAVSTYSSKDFTIPDDDTITGMVIRLRIDDSGVTVNETLKPIIRDKKTNAELEELIGEAAQTDTTMSLLGVAADAAETGVRESSIKKRLNVLEKYGTKDLLADIAKASASSNGVAYTWNNDGSCTVFGTSTGTSSNVILAKNNSSDLFIPGKNYWLKNDGLEVLLQVYWYRNGQLDDSYSANLAYGGVKLIAPSDVTGAIIRLRVLSGKTVNETVHPVMLTEPSSADLYDSIESISESVDNLESAVNSKANKSDLYLYNSVDVLEKAYDKVSGSTRYGITYEKDNAGGWNITGTATSDSFNNIAGSSISLPSYVVPGRTYYLDFHGGEVPVRIYIYKQGGGNNYKTYTKNESIRIPDDAIGILIRFQIFAGTTVNENIHYTFITEAIRAENAEEGGSGGGNVYNNTYNITTSPVITTDANGWLQPVDDADTAEADATDMTGPIMSMLTSTGYCHLAPGLYYVSGNIDMPAHTCLCGCGDKTTIRLLQSTASGYVIKMRQFCVVQDLCVSGSATASTPAEEGTRNGIHFEAANSSTPSVTSDHCMMSNVWIRNFSGSGLYCHETSINYAKGLYVSNVFITRCYKGINIDRYSEFNKFTNVCISWCHIACVNNGGNNIFTACTFHATGTGAIGFYIDGTKPNSAHGTLSGCTFCHIGSNAGSAITLENITAGFIVSDCQIWYDSIDITNCNGIVFSGCLFGRGTTGRGAVINIDNGGLSLFSGCVFNNDVAYPPVITVSNDAKARFSGCYGGVSGNEITV